MEYEDFNQDVTGIAPRKLPATPEEAVALWKALTDSQRIAIRAYERASDLPGNPTPAQIIALWRHGRIPRQALSREQRSAIMRELRRQVRRTSGGSGPEGRRRPTVPHSPGPRGGCRCASCRRQGRSLDRGTRPRTRNHNLLWPVAGH